MVLATATSEAGNMIPAPSHHGRKESNTMLSHITHQRLVDPSPHVPTASTSKTATLKASAISIDTLAVPLVFKSSLMYSHQSTIVANAVNGQTAVRSMSRTLIFLL